MGKKSMIRIGFIGAVSKEWMGGLNYLKNLLYAISLLQNKPIYPIVFIGNKVDTDVKKILSKHAQIVEHPMFDHKSIQWYIWKIGYKFFNNSFLLERLLKKYKIEVLSHSDITQLHDCKTINWIPDFQPFHLSEMYSVKDLKKRKNDLLKISKDSDAIIVSSFDARNDFENFFPEHIDKVNVLQFVSQPEKNYSLFDKNDEKKLRKRYGLSRPFFYIPNQFWKHKNHMVVIQAIKILKEQNKNVMLVCTGFLHDYRNVQHVQMLMTFIEMYNLQDNVKFLGLVDYTEVFQLIKFSEAVINPSLFEGWSSTVEECKSVGKNMILSNLNVHREQYPEATFFEKMSPDSLANILSSYNFSKNRKTNNLSLDIESRSKQFAQQYLTIIKNVLQG